MLADSRSFRLALLLAIAAVAGCASRDDWWDARQQGLAAGSRDGQAAGFRDGFESTFASTEQAAFAETIEELRAANRYRSLRSYKVRLWLEFVAVGYLLQWCVLGFLRKVLKLPDIEWMVFPSRFTEIEIGKKFSQLGQSINAAAPLLLCLCIAGCRDHSEEIWQDAYKAEYEASYRAGLGEGELEGRVRGQKDGVANAKAAARSGRSWRLYSPHIISACATGCVLGLIVQYTYLLCVSHSQVLNGLWAVLLVPAIRSSYAYKVYEQRRDFAVWVDQELEQLAAHRRLRLAQVESVRSLIQNRAAALSGLDDFIQARLLETAREKINAIVSTAENEARAAIRVRSAEMRYHCCPQCGRKFLYSPQSATRTVRCPNANCEIRITLPRVE